MFMNEEVLAQVAATLTAGIALEPVATDGGVSTVRSRRAKSVVDQYDQVLKELRARYVPPTTGESIARSRVAIGKPGA